MGGRDVVALEAAAADDASDPPRHRSRPAGPMRLASWLSELRQQVSCCRAVRRVPACRPRRLDFQGDVREHLAHLPRQPRTHKLGRSSHRDRFANCQLRMATARDARGPSALALGSEPPRTRDRPMTCPSVAPAHADATLRPLSLCSQALSSPLQSCSRWLSPPLPTRLRSRPRAP